MIDCIFCDIISGRALAHRIYQNRHVTVFLFLDGRPLVVPNRHYSDIFEIDDTHAAAVMTTATRIARATRAASGCDGINLV